MQNSNTMIVIITILIFGVIIAYFGTHEGNTDAMQEMNKLLDTKVR